MSQQIDKKRLSVFKTQQLRHRLRRPHPVSESLGESSFHFQRQLPAKVHPGRQKMVTQGLEPLSPTWVTQIQFPASVAFRGSTSKRKIFLCLPQFVRHALSLSPCVYN